jgi:hypothetical protein
MAELYRQTITDLAHALEHSDTRTEAAEAIRTLIDAIVLTERRCSGRARGPAMTEGQGSG